MRLVTKLGAGAAFLAFAVGASAATVDFTVGGTAVTSGTVDGVSYTVSPTPNNNESNTGTTCFAALACERDGFGIRDDEIGGSEVLTIGFGGTVQLSEFYVLDLFSRGGEFEVGEYRINGGSWQSFGSIANEEANIGLSGALIVSVFQSVSEIAFRAASNTFNNDTLGINDFALAGFSTGQTRISQVPLPGAAWLMLSALGGAGLLRRKKAAAKS